MKPIGRSAVMAPHAHDGSHMLRMESLRSVCAAVGQPGGKGAFSALAAGAVPSGRPRSASACGPADPSKVRSSTELSDMGVYDILKSYIGLGRNPGVSDEEARGLEFVGTVSVTHAVLLAGERQGSPI